MNNLILYLTQIVDPRKSKEIRHKQTTTLVIMIMAIRCGHTGLNAIARLARSHRQALFQVMPLPRGKTSSSSTIPRLSRTIEFDPWCHNWMRQYCPSEGLAIDGKSINSTVTSCYDSKQNLVSLVSFFGQCSNLVWRVGKLEKAKSSEIHKVPELLTRFARKQSVVTLDA